MKGVILAAGKGSRLYPVTHVIPKPLLPIANRMTMAYAFDRLKEMGIEQICIVVGENETQIREALGSGAEFGVALEFVRQTEPKGLAHAMSFTQEFIGDDPFVMYLGDAIYGSGFETHAKKFLESDCANLNIVKPVEDPSRFGVANVLGDRIVKLVEKPKQPESNLAMAGLYFFRKQIWDVLPELQPSARGEYEITDAIQLLIDRGETVLAGVYEGVWYDSGTLDSFLEVSAFLTGQKSVVAADANVNAEMKGSVVIGDGSRVSCASIEDSVILPQANVTCTGKICHSILSGNVNREGDIENEIIHGE